MIEKPIPKPRTILPEEVKPIHASRANERPMPKPRNIKRPIPKPRNIDRPIPAPRKEEGWLDWFLNGLRRTGEGLINFIPEGKVKDSARKLLSLIKRDESDDKVLTKPEEQEKQPEPEVKEYFRGKIQNIRIRGQQQMDIPTFFNRNKKRILEKIQELPKPL